MIFKNREQLSIIEINEEDGNKVIFERLAEILMDNPSNMVYCVKSGKLYGIISMGDVRRAKENNRSSIDINTSFTCLHGYEYMKARKLFLENDKINALPIVDEEHKLIGDYSRWDDVFWGYNFAFLMGNKYTDMFWKKCRKVAIVQPSKQIHKKMKMVKKWEVFLRTLGIEIEIIEQHDIVKAFDDKDMLFFTDEDEIRGLETLYGILDKKLKWGQAKTLNTIEEVIADVIADVIEENILRDLMDRGVYVTTIEMCCNENIYWKNFNHEIDSKFKDIGAKKGLGIHKEFWEDFYEDVYNIEYASDIGTQYYPHVTENWNKRLKDIEGKYYNVTNGERLTVGQPEKYNNTIWFFGPCFIVGWRVEDAHTMESRLQEILNENRVPSRVVNCGCWSNKFQLLFRICSTHFKQGDVAIIYDEGKCFSGIPSINLADCLERENVPACWVWDQPIHPNHKVFKLWAEEIYNYIPKHLLGKKADGDVDKENEKNFLLTNVYLERYFANYKANEAIGSIVMNCNPFTYGHRFLIEEACKRVNQLIVFVVEENKSLFSFKERFAMVVEGTKDLKNVLVVPSGNFILSQQTFPEYFLKVEDENVSHNAEFDIEIFANVIAPRLNIKYRFVGEEKADAVTAEYNNAMKKILPQHGIEIVEIPRKIGMNGNPISATYVRDLLNQGKFDEVRAFVPQTTFDILVKSWV